VVGDWSDCKLTVLVLKNLLITRWFPSSLRLVILNVQNWVVFLAFYFWLNWPYQARNKWAFSYCFAEGEYTKQKTVESVFIHLKKNGSGLNFYFWPLFYWLLDWQTIPGLIYASCPSMRWIEKTGPYPFPFPRSMRPWDEPNVAGKMGCVRVVVAVFFCFCQLGYGFGWAQKNNWKQKWKKNFWVPSFIGGSSSMAIALARPFGLLRAYPENLSWKPNRGLSMRFSNIEWISA